MKQEIEQMHAANPVCLVVMPLADIPPYESGHFQRVFDYIFKPAGAKAGFAVELSGEHLPNQMTMRLPTIERTLSAGMVIFDLTTNVPSILYLVGIRQAFDLPTILVRDTLTERTFDIQGIHEIEYRENLRIDNVNQVIDQVADTLRKTYASKEPIPSVVALLGVRKAEIRETMQIPSELGDLLLSAITNVKDQIAKTSIESSETYAPSYGDEGVATELKKKTKKVGSWVDSEGTVFQVGDIITHPKFGLGIIVDAEPDGRLSIKFHTIGVKLLQGGVEKLQLL